MYFSKDYTGGTYRWKNFSQNVENNPCTDFPVEIPRIIFGRIPRGTDKGILGALSELV